MDTAVALLLKLFSWMKCYVCLNRGSGLLIWVRHRVVGYRSADKVKPSSSGGVIVGIDYLEMDEIPETTILMKDFTDDDAPEMLKQVLGGQADVVMSDMAPPTTGHRPTDHLRIMSLAEMAYQFAREVLAPDGVFIAKLLQGGAQKTLLDSMKKDFKKVRHIKPDASRKDSSEMYIVGQGFRG